MESIHKKTGKVFTGKFAETAVKIGLAVPDGEAPAKKTPAKPKVKPKRKAKK